jgi:hypothetical protein
MLLVRASSHKRLSHQSAHAKQTLYSGIPEWDRAVELYLPPLANHIWFCVRADLNLKTGLDSSGFLVDIG